MNLDIQFKIKNNSRYLQYLRDNSIWYKILNRDPLMFSEFEKKVREQNRIYISDRISKALNTIEMIQNVFTTFK